MNLMCVGGLRSFFEPRGVVIVGARRSFGFGYGIPLFLQKQGWGNRRHLVKSAGFTVRDWFGDLSSVREQYPDKPLVSVAIGHPECLDDLASLCGRSIPIFTSPEAATRALAALWSYSRARKKTSAR